MATDTKSAPSEETSEETELQAETATTTPTSETPESTTTEPSSSQISLEELQAQIKRLDVALKKANADAKSHRLENADLKKFKEQTEAEKLSAEDKQELARKAIEKQLADAQLRESETVRQLQEERNTRALERAGRSAGIADAVALDDAISIALQSAELEHDEQGKPMNADEVMKQIVKSRPWLVPQAGKTTPPTAGGATNPRTTNRPSEVNWESIGKMKTEAEYQALSREIQRFMNDPKNNKRL